MNLDELERLAKAATPGPWLDINTDKDAGHSHCLGCPTFIEIGVDRKPFNYKATYTDLDYIAAANPSTVLKLIDVARAAKEVLREASDNIYATEILFRDKMPDYEFPKEFWLFGPIQEALAALNEEEE